MTKRLVQWFGSNTENRHIVGELLQNCRFVGIPFAGGMVEIPYITAKQILVNDIHRYIINLCMAIKNSDSLKYIIKSAVQLPYHPDILKHAQEIVKGWIPPKNWQEFSREVALWYFVAVWMNRGGKAGTDKELEGSLPIRWNANGGGSNRRYRTAIESLNEWNKTFQKCEFLCMDGLKFIERFPDNNDNGLYVDAPWPGAGDSYLHKFTKDNQIVLCELLSKFKSTKIIIRFGEHPLIRELYKDWSWVNFESRNQANIRNPEWIIHNLKP